MAKEHCYLGLMHGRDYPDQQLNDWGFEGPIIGPVNLHWTYGILHIHHPEFLGFEELPEEKGLIVYGGKYYGDYDIWPEDHAAIDQNKADAHKPGAREIHDYARFVQGINFKP